MRIEKNKIVFAAVLAVLFLFLISYSLMIMGDDESETENLKQTLVPDLEADQKEYGSKLDAINDLKEVRENNAPSIYDEKLIDSLGFYDPDLERKEKERIADSIYRAGRITYTDYNAEPTVKKTVASLTPKTTDSAEIEMAQKVQVNTLGLEHQLFFASSPIPNGNPNLTLYAVVDGDQVVMANSRLRMRLAKSANIDGERIPKNTLIFGFISFQPNRALINIEHIEHHPAKLKAFDLQDGSEGIYAENSFREEATNEVLDDIVQDINIPSVPQLGGITQVFRRTNRRVRVTVLNNYRLILKPKS